MKLARRTWWRIAVWLVGYSVTSVGAADLRVLTDLAYKEGASAAETERCRIDLYLPAEGKGFASLLWLHGGGITGGSRNSAATQRVARRLAEAGIAVGSAGYRLNPGAKFPAYVEDSAAAFAWLKKSIAQHGGDDRRVFIGGHSAGAYLALMVVLDGKYLAAHGLDETAIAGVVPISGQTVTHFTVREERHPGDSRIRIDDAAPLFHVRKLPFPFLIFTAEKDMALRGEENRLLASALREAKCERVIERTWEGRDHGTVFSHMSNADDPVAAELVRFIRESR